jgi:hypothetical protein
MTHRKLKPQPGERHGASGLVVAGAIDNSEHRTSIANLQEEHLRCRYLLPAPIVQPLAALHFAAGQLMTIERHICDECLLRGVVRESHNSRFVAISDEQVLGPNDSCRQATDALVDLMWAGGSQ